MKTIRAAPGRRSRSQPSSAVGYVFGVLEAAAVPGSILVPLLTDLGMSPAAVRTMLHRMVGADNLTSERAGRTAVYRLAGGYADRFREFRDGGGAPSWDGRFQLVLYDIPEANRQERDELRELAFKAGFGAARPGVLIGMRDPRSWCQPWLESPGLAVELGELACSLATARRLAEQAWGLTGIQPRLTAFARELDDIAARLTNDEYDDRKAFRLQADLWERWVGILLGLPMLPEQLTPDPWPVADLSLTMSRLTYQLQRRAVEHAAAVVAGAERADLLERLPNPKYRLGTGHATGRTPEEARPVA